MSDGTPNDPPHSAPQAPARSQSPGESTTPAVVVYALYLCALVSGITAIVGVVIAYVNRGTSADWLDSHYRFQIRTFWIFLLGSVLGALLSLILVGWLLLLFLLVWLIVRCVKGIQLVSRGQGYPNPETWFW